MKKRLLHKTVPAVTVSVLLPLMLVFSLSIPASAVKLTDVVSSQDYSTKLAIGNLLIYMLEDRSPSYFDRSDYNEEDLLYYLLVMRSYVTSDDGTGYYNYSTDYIDSLLRSIYGVEPTYSTKYGGADGYYADPGVYLPSDGSVYAPEITTMISLPDGSWYVEFYGGYAYIEKTSSGWSFIKYGTGFTLTESQIIANMQNPPPQYGYDDVTDSESEASSIISLAESSTGGTVWCLYMVTDDIFYAVTYSDGTYSGALIQKVISDGQNSLALLTSGLLEVSEIEEYVSAAAIESNINLTSAAESGCTLISEYIDFLDSALDNISGRSPNDPAMQEITDFVTDALALTSGYTMHSSNNSVTVTYSAMSSALDSVKANLEVFRVFLDSEGISLSTDDIPTEVTIECYGMDLSEDCDVIISERIFGTIATADVLTISFGDDAPAISFTAEALKAVVGAYGDLTVRCRRLQTGVYKINFADSNEALINAINSSGIMYLPSTGSETVFLRNLSGSISTIDGYYSGGMTEFTIHYSGVYAYSESGAMTEESDDDNDTDEEAIVLEISVDASPSPTVTVETESTGFSVNDTIKLFIYLGAGLLVICAAVGIIFIVLRGRNSSGKHRR